jgi:uncharacterized membrane protein
MSRHRLLVLALLLSAAACTRADRAKQQPDQAADSTADSTAMNPALVLTDSSDVRAAGTGPDWRVDIWPTLIRYRGVGTSHFVAFPRVNPEVAGDTRIYRTRRDSTPTSLELTLTRGSCTGATPSVRGNWNASLVVDGQTMTGCARVMP